MYNTLKETYYLPDLLDVLKEATSSCFFCKTMKPQQSKYMKYGEKIYPNLLRKQVRFDIIGGLNTIKGFRFIYIFVDLYTGFVIYMPTKSKTSKEILHAFKHNYLQIMDFPDVLYSDNEKGVLSHEMKDFCQQHSIELKTNSPHSPESNSIPEQMTKQCKIALRLMIKSKGSSWLDLLFYMNIAVNKRKLRTGWTPQMLGLGNNSQTTALLKESEDYQNQNDFMNFMMKKWIKLIPCIQLKERNYLTEIESI